jgi:hypothetical protein
MEKSHISDQSMNIDLLDRINDIVKRLFEIKRSNKVKRKIIFFLF